MFTQECDKKGGNSSRDQIQRMAIQISLGNENNCQAQSKRNLDSEAHL